ncbi:unnamed protein product [Dibothriocephalus latus]|uniref:Uncharacterized protein n=1 Tax=Dibothriocephalus latus TaxID=60516 RepID=A0A3P7LP75_DIBLA|nr:unnamed protein product [Dibothriocephalus latus]
MIGTEALWLLATIVRRHLGWFVSLAVVLQVAVNCIDLCARKTKVGRYVAIMGAIYLRYGLHRPKYRVKMLDDSVEDNGGRRGDAMVGEEERVFPSEKPSGEDVQCPRNDLLGYLDSTEVDETRLLQDENGGSPRPSHQKRRRRRFRFGRAIRRTLRRLICCGTTATQE